MSAIREQFFKNWEEHGPRDAQRKAAHRPPEDVRAVRDVLYLDEQEWDVPDLDGQVRGASDLDKTGQREQYPADVYLGGMKQTKTCRPEVYQTKMCQDEAGREHWLDIFFPEKFEGTLPAIVDVHGGGWVYGNKELNEYYCMELAKLGFVVFDINYRLAPATDLKGQVQDVTEALNWVFRNAKQYRADPHKVYLTGDSAGAQLALLTCAATSNKEYRKIYDIPCLAGTVSGLGLTCPVTCLHQMASSTDEMTREWVRIVYGVEAEEVLETSLEKTPLWNYSDPHDYLAACRIPPLYILTTRGDENYYWQSEELHRMLLEHHVEHAYRVWSPTGTEELRHVFNVLYLGYADSQMANQEMAAFFLKK